ncbi:hypothetical protein GW17_00028525 [Ensete ventricosum]|nr:hypothetical protein GW17_00028525 [Ensete ventricosum]
MCKQDVLDFGIRRRKSGKRSIELLVASRSKPRRGHLAKWRGSTERRVPRMLQNRKSRAWQNDTLFLLFSSS